MGTKQLSVIFAPCILRTNRSLMAHETLNDVARQTKAVDAMIREQLIKLKRQLSHIKEINKEIQEMPENQVTEVEDGVSAKIIHSFYH